MKTETIRTSESKNKTSEYLKLATHYKNDAIETANETGNVFVSKIADEIYALFFKVKNADCEYTAYVNCNAIEIWHSKIEEAFA